MYLNIHPGVDKKNSTPPVVPPSLLKRFAKEAQAVWNKVPSAYRSSTPGRTPARAAAAPAPGVPHQAPRGLLSRPGAVGEALDTGKAREDGSVPQTPLSSGMSAAAWTQPSRVKVPELPPVACRDLAHLALLCSSSPPGTVIDLGGRIMFGPLAEGHDVLAITRPDIALRGGTLSLSGMQRVLVDGAGGVCFDCVNVVTAAAAAGTSRHGRDLVMVQGQGASLRLHRCSVASDPSATVQHSLVAARMHGCLTLEHCRIEGATRGMACSVVGSAHLTLVNSTLTNCHNLLVVTKGSTAIVTDATFSRADGAAAVFVADAASVLRAQQCEWDGVNGDGLQVATGARAVLSDCLVGGSVKGSGLRVTGWGSSATATGCRFSDNFLCAVGVAGGGRANLEQCRLTGSGSTTSAGLGASGAGSTVVATGCKMVANSGWGAMACGGARMELHACELSAPLRYSALEVRGGTSSAVAHDCRLVDSALCGCDVYDGACLTLHRCVLTGNRRAAGTVQDAGSRMVYGDCMVGDSKWLALHDGWLEAIPKSLRVQPPSS